MKKTEKTPQGGIVEVSRPIHVSKVSLRCPKCKKITRVGMRLDGKKKVRICKKCRETL